MEKIGDLPRSFAKAILMGIPERKRVRCERDARPRCPFLKMPSLAAADVIVTRLRAPPARPASNNRQLKLRHPPQGNVDDSGM